MKQLVLGMAAYTSASILGPLLIFVTIGHFIDRATENRLLYKLIGMGMAFVLTNIMLFKKVQKLNVMMENYGLEKKKEKEDALQKKKLMKKQ